jgi:hypothetical protein
MRESEEFERKKKEIGPNRGSTYNERRRKKYKEGEKRGGKERSAEDLFCIWGKAASKKVFLS